MQIIFLTLEGEFGTLIVREGLKKIVYLSRFGSNPVQTVQHAAG